MNVLTVLLGLGIAGFLLSQAGGDEDERAMTVIDRHGEPLKVKHANGKWLYYFDNDWIPLEWLGGAPSGKVWSIVGGKLAAVSRNPRKRRRR